MRNPKEICSVFIFGWNNSTNEKHPQTLFQKKVIFDFGAVEFLNVFRVLLDKPSVREVEGTLNEIIKV